MIRVLIADDHPLIRRGLRDILAETPDIVVEAEATNAAEAIDLVRSGEWDVVLMDITMPGRTGLDALRDIKAERPMLPVLMLSIHPEEQYALRAIRNGASGYLTKESAPEELVQAIHKVVAGGRYVTVSLAERLAEEVGGASSQSTKGRSHSQLSDREFEVLCRIGTGRTVSQIGKEMHLSPKTISTYRTRLLEKLSLETTADLIKYCVDKHISG